MCSIGTVVIATSNSDGSIFFWIIGVIMIIDALFAFFDMSYCVATTFSLSSCILPSRMVTARLLTIPQFLTLLEKA